MEEKKSYMPKEVEKMFSAYEKYKESASTYNYWNGSSFKVVNLENYRLEMNRDVDNCNKKMPSSLVNKLGIKKVE